MGDSVFAGFISGRSDENTILSSITNTEIIASGGELSPPDEILAFRAKNPAYIRHAIQLCLEKAGMGLEDVSHMVPHTPYNMIWDVVSELLHFPRERILTEYLPDTGHLNSNDSFVHYARAAADGRIEPGQICLLVNPAFGGTRGCTIIRR
jgi:3-oxoacyl-[acyl-carrier-protein] synthase-3